MADEKPDEQHNPPLALPAPKPGTLVMTITIVPGTNRCEVNGPIDNNLVAFGMLEMARATLIKRQIRKELSPVAVPVPSMPGPGKN